MNNFASLTLTELSPILAILAGMLVGFYGLMKFVLNNATKTSEADRDERKELSHAIANMADAMNLVAVSNKRIADESKLRNGHLAEISLENKDQILNAIKGLTIDKQTVHHQTVETSTVMDETVKHETVLNKKEK